MTPMTLMTMICRGFLKGWRHPIYEMRDGAMSRVIGSTRPTKGDADAKYTPSTLLQVHPLYSHRWCSPSRLGFEQPAHQEGKHHSMAGHSCRSSSDAPSCMQP